MNAREFNIIERDTDTGNISAPALLPCAESLVSNFGCLLWVGERLTLSEFAERIRMEAGSLEVTNPNEADRFAFELIAWESLMKYAKDCVAHFNALPVEFFLEYEDIEYHYEFDDCLKVLGEPAVAQLGAEIATGEEEVA